MIAFTDQLGSTIQLKTYPQRIISIVPSQTELLFDLGLQEQVVGITKFCVHPEEWFRKKTRVGGTKTLNMDMIRSLKPDLVIANKEENTREQIQELATWCPVWISDVYNLETALEMIVSIGQLTNKYKEALELAGQIKTNFNHFSIQKISNREIKTAYLIWKDPYMTVGADTFIHAMLETCGLKNGFAHLTRYPEIDTAQLQNANCELLLLSSEPFPFSQKHIEELEGDLPGTEIMLVDGEMFSWYGSRLIYAAGYLQKVIGQIDL